MKKYYSFFLILFLIVNFANGLTIFETYDNQVVLDKQKALKILLKEYEKDGENILLNYKIGKHYEQEHFFKYPFMTKYYFRYLELAPKDDSHHDEVIFGIVEYYLSKGARDSDETIIDSENSIPPYEKINVYSLLNSAVDKSVPNYNLYLGLYFMINKKYEEAIKYFELTPIEKTSYKKSKWLFNNLGYAFIKMNNLEKAEKALRMAEFIDPSNVYVHVNLGYVYYNTHRYMDAVKQYKQALDINPTYQKAIQGLTDSRKMIKSIKPVL